jgi:hypothetical protein
MGMNPAKSHDFVLDLCFKQLNFVCHVAVVSMAFLGRNYQSVYDESRVSFTSCQYCTGFQFLVSVCLGYLDKAFYYLERTVDSPQLA